VVLLSWCLAVIDSTAAVGTGAVLDVSRYLDVDSSINIGSSLRRGDDEDSSSLQSTVFHMHVIDIEVALDCRHNAPSAPCSIDSA